MILGHFEGSNQSYYGIGKEFTKGRRCRVTIDMLPDLALLEIFDSYVDEEQIDAWYTLVHVCRRWRNIVFGSPWHLNLRLYCKASTPVSKTLDAWPQLPIAVWSNNHEKWGVDNIIAALEHNDRICELDFFDIPSSQLEKVLAVMQEPFPALTSLHLQHGSETAPAVPTSFLGGSAPRLQTLFLNCIPFPGLPKLLLSATHLIYLDLRNIPHSGYFSPEAMAASLSVLTSLERLVIRFKFPRCYPNQRNQLPPPPTRTLLPVLAVLQFKGFSEYLEVLVARIDTPLLNKLAIKFFHQLTFDTPQLTHFITRTPKFKAHGEARVVFYDWGVWVTLPQTIDGMLQIGISCRQSDWQLSSLAQVCSSSFPQALNPAVEHLYVLEDRFPRRHWQDDIESSQWLEFLHPFAAVKTLYISREFVPRIVPALQELVGDRVTEVLPTLQTLFIEGTLPSGPVQDAIGQFVAARQLSSHPIAVSRWERK